MSCLRRERVVSVESIVVVVRERRAARVARAGVEALGLLGCDVRELRHPRRRCGGLVCGRGVSGWFVAAAHLPALVWLPFVLDRVREIEPVLRRRPVEQPHDASHAELLIVSSRRLRFARWAAHLPVKRARGFPARAARVFCILISRRLGGYRSER